MGKLFWLISALFIFSPAPMQEGKGLKDYYQAYFPVGAAVTPRSLQGADSALILREFNTITAENAMKMGPIHPAENTWNWKDADAIVNFAQRHGLKIRGHNLLWHQQTAAWMFKDAAGGTVSKEVLLQRLKDHITVLVNRYKGKIYAWDVVNEAIDDNPALNFRNSPWYQICGEDFIAKAFEYAHAADPAAILVYNDYNTENPGKRERIYTLLKRLLDEKVPVHAVGLQAHWSVFGPTEKELIDAIELYASLGLKIHFTELDVSIYRSENLRREKNEHDVAAFTPDLEQKQIAQYKMAFDVFRRYRQHITSVTFWNVSDRSTWLDNYPVRGRKNYPLLFDTTGARKKAYAEVVRF